MPTYNNLPKTSKFFKGKWYHKLVEDLRLAGLARAIGSGAGSFPRKAHRTGCSRLSIGGHRRHDQEEPNKTSFERCRESSSQTRSALPGKKHGPGRSPTSSDTRNRAASLTGGNCRIHTTESGQA